MANTQYDLPEKVVKLFRMKEEERKKTKAYFTRLITNPHRCPGEENFPDVQVFRFTSTLAYLEDFYKPTSKVSFVVFACYGLPVLLTSCYLIYSRNKKEQKIRSGLMAYKDRSMKWYF